MEKLGKNYRDECGNLRIYVRDKKGKKEV